MFKNWLSNLVRQRRIQDSGITCMSFRIRGSSNNRLRRNRRGHGAANPGELLERRALLTAYVVNTTEDGSLVPDGQLSLREAITAANTNLPSLDAVAGEVGPGTVDTITFDPSLNGMTITLSGASLTITDHLTISDGNSSPITVDANGNSRVFEIGAGAGHVTISDITITGGTAVSGGGVLISAGESLTLSQVTVTSNTANGNAAGDGGGGIYNDGGSLIVSDSTISGNRAVRAGGGIESSGSVDLSNVSLTDNNAGTSGGGLHVTGAAATTVVGGTVSGNSAAEEGGGLWNGTGMMTISGGTVIQDNSAAGSGSDQGGGGVFNAGGTVSISGATISNNLASGGTRVTLSGDQESPAVATSATGDAQFQFNAITETFDLRLLVTGIELTDTTSLPELTGAHIHLGDVGVNGSVIVNLLAVGAFQEVDGGILLTLNDVPFPTAHVSALLSGGTYFNVHSTDNTGGEIRGQITFAATMGSGGGVFNDGGALTVTGGTVSGNIASRAGGGIETNGGTVILSDVNLDTNIAGPSGAATPGDGGGLHVTGAATVDVSGGTVSSNIAASEGGGLWNGSGTMTIDNGTVIADNTASGSVSTTQGGGGVFNNGGMLVVDGSTSVVQITGNDADGLMGSGGGILNLGGTMSLDNVTLSGNSASRAGGGIEQNAGVATVVNSTLSANIAGSAPGNGGGLHVTGVGDVTVHNSTVSGNTASSEGGGLWNSSTGTLTVRNTTVVNNHSDVDGSGGGLFTAAGGSTILVNTIVAGNDSGSLMTADDLGGVAILAGSNNNLIADASTSGGLVDGSSGNIVGVNGSGTRDINTILNAMLQGGANQTQTHTLLIGSAAIDAGADLSAIGIIVDQIGQSRPLGAAFDIGAAEFDASTAGSVEVSIADAATVSEGQDATFEVSLNQDPSVIVTVTVTTQSDSAVSSLDFTPTSRTLTFRPGESLTQSITVETLDDSEAEVQETFFVNLNATTGATIDDGQAVGTINDNDTPPVLDPTPRFPDTKRPTLTWQPVTGSAGYEIWLGRVFPSGSRVLASESMVESTSFTPSVDLDPAFYRYWVRSFDSSGAASQWSESNTFEIRPTLVSPLTLAFNQRPTFEWESIPHAPGYEIFLRTTAGDTVVSEIAGTTFTPDSDLAQGRIRWWIRSSDAIDNRGWSVAGMTGSQTTVTAPIGQTNDATPTFAWESVQGAGRYILYVQNRDTADVVIRENRIVGTSFTANSDLATGNYRVWVKAIDGTSDTFSSGQWSRPVDFTVSAANNSEPSGITSLLALELIGQDAQEVDQKHVRVADATSGRTLTPNRQHPSQRVADRGTEQDVMDSQAESLTDFRLLDNWMADPEQVALLLNS